MFLAYIAFAVASGLCSAVVALILGSGIFLAFVSYIVGGFVALLLALLVSALPKRPAIFKYAPAQRSQVPDA